MLKIHQLFLRTFLIIFSSLLIVISIATYFWSKSIYIDQIEKNMSHNIDTLAISLSNFDNIDTQVLRLKEATNLRVTIINKEGKVIAESDKDKNIMENHASRFEIIQAKHHGIGKIIRLSNTVNEELLYIAKKVTIHKQTYYIRMSSYLNQVQENFYKLTLQIIAIFTFFLILAFLTSYLISQRMKKETDNILHFLINLTKKQEITYLASSYTVEFNNISRLLKKVALRLEKREKQKSKHTAKLKLANKQKDEIIGAISHEFKNPIAIISGYSETILSDDELPESMKSKFLEKIHSNAHKMSQIIDRLRLSLKLEEDKEPLTLISCSMKKICEDIASDLEAKYKDREIIIQGEDVKKPVDETLMSIAISNLVENALKYSEEEVIIKIESNGLKIIDTGLGISENELSKITRKFYRVSQNGWNNSLGLGLYIVHSILGLHKFELEIHSIFHEGSEFKIRY